MIEAGTIFAHKQPRGTGWTFSVVGCKHTALEHYTLASAEACGVEVRARPVFTAAQALASVALVAGAKPG